MSTISDQAVYDPHAHAARLADLKTSRNARRKQILSHLAFLAILCCVLWASTCGLWDLRGPDEGRYVQISKELLDKSNWFRLTLHGEAYDQKPPLEFWLIALSLKLFGGVVTSWAARLPSVLMGLGAVLLTYMMGRIASGGRGRVGLMSALILLTIPLFGDNVPQAELNVPFTFWITLAMALWFQAGRSAKAGRRLSFWYAVGFWLALAGAFFTKGPLAFLIVLAPIAVEAWALRSAEPFRRVSCLWGLPVLASLIAGWLYAEYRVHGSEFVTNQVGKETIHGFLKGSHAEPFWYYIPRLFTGLFPWAFLLPLAAWHLWKTRSSPETKAIRPFIAWAVIPFLILCLANGKRQSYLLPLLPPFAVIIAIAVMNLKNTMIPESGQRREKIRLIVARSLSGLCAAAGVVLMLAALTWFAQPSVFARAELALTWHTGAIWIVASAAAFWLSFHIKHRSAPHDSSGSFFSLFNCTVAIMLGVAMLRYTTIDPALDPVKTTKPLAKQIEALGAGQVGAVGKASKAEYHVYGSYRIKELKPADLGQAAQLPDILVVKLAELQKHSASLAKAGYQQLDQGPVAREPLAILSRPRDFIAHRVKAAQHKIVSNPEQAVFALAGDTGIDNQRVRNIAGQIAGAHKKHPLDALFLLGDNQYQGDAYFGDANPLFENSFDSILAAKIPVFATLGNHDYKKGRWLQQVAYSKFNMGGRRYYSRSFGRDLVTFFILDSESLQTAAGDSAQVAWLKQELSVCHSTWKIALLHRPMLASDIAHGPSRKLAGMLMSVMNGPHGDIDLVVSGHNHVYERRQVGRDGMLHLTAGSGGQLSDETFPPDPLRAAGYNKKGVFLRMAVEHDLLHIDAINEAGLIVDAADVLDFEGPAQGTVEVHNSLLLASGPALNSAMPIP